MQQKNLKQTFSKFGLFFLFLNLLISCQQTENKGNKLKELQQENKLNPYITYVDSGIFDNKRFLKDISDIWICYKFHKDNLGSYSDDYFFDDNNAAELSSYLYLELKQDTLIANNLFKLPIYAYAEKVKNLSFGEEKYINMLRGSEIDSTIHNYYFIRPYKNMEYCEYHEIQMEKGDTLPVFGSTYPFKRFAPFSGLFAYYNSTMITSFSGYIYYFKRGQPYKNSNVDIGIPGSFDNRFSVNRTYTNCNIKQAAYKLIEDFPKGTQGMLIADDEPNEKGEQELHFPTSSFELYSTVYDWQGTDKLTITVGHNRNCEFIFEFSKKGSDVHVKYWNNVVFPFEKEYEGH